MGNCKDCKYWHATSKHHLDGRCYAITLRLDKLAAIQIIGHGWEGAALITAHDFGCVLFEQKESE